MRNNQHCGKYVLMISTAVPGGIRAVVDGYERDAVFQRWNVRTLFSHIEGGVLRRINTAAGSLIHFLALLAFRRVKLVHCHVSMWGSFWRKSVFAELARLFRVPVIFHLHGSEMKIFFSSQRMLGKTLITRELQRVDAVVVLSDSWKAFIRTIAPSAKVTIIHNYVAPPIWSACRKPHAGVRVIFLGLLGPRKGIFELLEAFKKVSIRIPDITLVVGGNGDVRRVTDSIQLLGLAKRIHVAGWISGDKKSALLATSDIFVLPSHNEGLPISILEAMSWGLPIISTQVGGIPELVRNGEDGILINAGDVSALAASLERLALDETLRAKLGFSARRRVESIFSPDVVLPQLDEIYIRLIEFRTRKRLSVNQGGDLPR